MERNYFNKLRKSSLTKIAIPVLTNLVVIGQPVQQMILDHYANKAVSRIVSNYNPSDTDGRTMDSVEKISVENRSVNNRSAEYGGKESSGVFYALESKGVIGKLFESEAENPLDNYFTINLPAEIDFNNYEAKLVYDLYGLDGVSQVTKSINDNMAYGGQVASVNDEWHKVEEFIPNCQLRSGQNTIFFNRRAEENYQYRIKNLHIELSEKKSLINLSEQQLINCKGTVYLVGTTTVDIDEIEVLGKTIPVHNRVFEGVLTDISEETQKLNLFVKEKNGQRRQMEVSVAYKPERNQLEFNNTNSDIVGKTYFLGSDIAAYDALSINIKTPEEATDGRVFVQGLHFKDVKTLENELINVTLGDFSGYRIKKVHLPDTVAVELHLKYDPDKIPEGYFPKDVKTFYFDRSQHNWKVLAVDSLDYEKKEIIVTTYNNDTDYINGVIKVPESPETGSFTPTSISEMKFADPTAGIVSIAPPIPNNSGSASTSFPIKLPQGRSGLQPSLAVTYSSEAGNGWMGIGWNIATPAITLNTKWGAPLFDSGNESEMYSLNGSDLVYKNGSTGPYGGPHRMAQARNTVSGSTKTFYLRKEGSYQRVVRRGTTPSSYWWEVTDKQGNKSYYGGVSAVDNNAVIKTPEGKIAHWALKRIQDPYGNYVEYNYSQSSASYTIPGTTIAGKEFYVDNIRYTRHTSQPTLSATSYYEVAFKRTNYTVPSSGTSVQKSDIIVNSRNGYNQVIDELLTEIHVSFKQYGQAIQRIRSYRFDYDTAPFGKQQLIRISEYDGGNKLFYSNTMKYYDPLNGGNVISGSNAPWNNTAGNDNVYSPLANLSGINPALVFPGSVLGTSVSSGAGGGLRIGFGIDTDKRYTSTSNTVGGSWNFSFNNVDTKISFIDVNGDGRPDKVYENGSLIRYRPNLGNSFGDFVALDGINSLSTIKARSTVAGVDVNVLGLVGAGKSWSTSRSTTDNYFTDINGDGLPDIVSGNWVRFNTSNSLDNMIRTFDTDVSESENKITSGPLDQQMIEGLELETMEELREENPQFDHVKVWQAPYSGQVVVTGNAILRAVNTDADNHINTFRVTIEHGIMQTGASSNTTLTTKTLIPSDLNASKSMSSSLHVDKGELLFFRIHNQSNGYGGEVEWNPNISYSSMDNIQEINLTDDNGKYIYRYNAKDDYIVNNGEGLSFAAQNTTVYLNFNLPSIAALQYSDDIDFVIKKTRIKIADGTETTSPSWEWRRTYNHEQGTLSNNNTVTHTLSSQGTYRDVFHFYIESTSNVDWGQITWQPTITVDGTQVPGSVTCKTYDDNINQLEYWITDEQLVEPVINTPYDEYDDFLRVSHNMFDLDYSNFVNGFENEDFPIKINWVVKAQKGSTTQTLNKEIFYLYRIGLPGGGWDFVFTKTPLITDDIDPVTDTDFWNYDINKITVKEVINNSGKIFSAFYIENHKFGEGNIAGISFNLLGVSDPQYPIHLTTPYIAAAPNFTGYTYRGWGQFLYNGALKFERDNEGNITNPTPAYFDGPIDVSEINYAQQANGGEIPEINPNQPEVAIDQLQPGPVRYSFYSQDNQNLRYVNEAISEAVYGYNTSGELTASVGRLGEGNIHDLFIDESTLTSGDPGIFFGMKQRSVSKGSAVSGNLATVNGSESKASSNVLNHYMDLNGDRYPDFVSDKVQYTNLMGALSSKVTDLDFRAGDDSEDSVEGFSLPGNPAKSTESDKGTNTGNKTNTNINAGANDSNGSSFNSRQWVDMNGDGLADKVLIEKTKIQVWLNKGYGFEATPIVWGTFTQDLLVSSRSNVGFSLGFSTPTKTISFAAGLGGGRSVATLDAVLVDINGDQLPELIYNSGLGYKYLLNTGKGFSGSPQTFYSTAIEEDISTSGSTYGTFTFGFPIPIPIIPLKIVFSPAININAGINEKSKTLADLDGDGLIDVIAKGNGNSSSLTARLNQVGKTHLLKTVHTPLGGHWTIDYQRSANSYEMPNSTWLLTSIVTDDGFHTDQQSGYGPDESIANIVYENPNYNRREREFFGFEKVTIQEMDPESPSTMYRYVTTTYHNDSYYLNGAAKSTATYSASGELLAEKEMLYNLLNPDNPQVNQSASVNNYFLQGSLLSNAELLLDQSRLFVTLARVTSTSYEDGQGLSAVQEFLSYDNKGNLTSYIDYGQGGEDSFRSDIEYYTTIGLDYGLGFPKSIKVYQNSNNNPMRERNAQYNNKGKLTQVSVKINQNDENRVSFDYDTTFGNLTAVHQLDLLDEQQSGHFTQNIAYDNVVNTYPTSFENSFGETSSTTYNYLFGIPVFTTDMNDASMRTRIDNRGRVLEVTGPNELATESGTSAWTIRMEYKGEDPITGNISPGVYMLPAKGTFAAIDPNTAPPTAKEHFALTRHFDPLTANNQFITISIVDGFGQPIQLKKTHRSDVTKWMVGGFEQKDGFGRTIKTYLPATQSISGSLNFYNLGTYCTYYNVNPSSLQSPTEMEYDERNRTTSVKQPGESVAALIEYEIDGDLFVQKVINELSQTMDSYTDIRGRQRKTVQNDEIATLFDYNAINELVRVTDNDGFMTNYIYDFAGRTLEVQHPDRGIEAFKYDKAGNITEKSTSNLYLNGNQKILYQYDYGRLIKVQYPLSSQNEVKYTYGEPNDDLAEELNAVGRLLYQEDGSGIQLFGYGLMGEVTKNLRSVATAGYQSFWFYTKWKYDSWNRVQQITYPDHEQVNYNYNNAGMLFSVTSTLGTQEVVKSITYTDYGERSEIVYGNDTKTTYDYDVRRRMNMLGHGFTNLQVNNKYEYDALSNITGITSQDPSSSLPGQGHIGGPLEHLYDYDDYNRLSYARGKYVGSNDISTPYLQQEYELNMAYNTNHTIDNKVQLHKQGLVDSYGDSMYDESPVYRNSYDLRYEEYGTASFVAGPNSYGYTQPHAPRRIVEYPSWVSNPDPEDPRIRHKEIEYDANGNQTEIKEKVGEVYSSLRKNLWDEENRLQAIDLKPDESTDHPVAVYTYDASGARIIRYNLDRIDVSSNAQEVGQAKKDNVMIYPNGFVMGKATEAGLDENRLTYTKHYYIGSERVSAKTGTVTDLGLYPRRDLETDIENINHDAVRDPSDISVDDTETAVGAIYLTFGQSAPNFSSLTEDDGPLFSHDLGVLNTFYFHKDHLGSSSYMTNASGNVTQHMEYLPFGELLADEHTNSFNSPFKFNGKEYDEETGNYYYGARYYDPKWSIFISVDPLAEKTMSSYGYCYNNPVRYIDPTGMEGDDWIKNNSTGQYVWDDNVTSTSNTPEGYSYVGHENSDIIKDLFGKTNYTESTRDWGSISVEDYETAHSKGVGVMQATTKTNISISFRADVDEGSYWTIMGERTYKNFKGVGIDVAISGNAINGIGAEMKLLERHMTLQGNPMKTLPSDEAMNLLGPMGHVVPGGNVPTLTYQNYWNKNSIQNNFGKSYNLNFNFKGIYVGPNGSLQGGPGLFGAIPIENTTNLSLSVPFSNK